MKNYILATALFALMGTSNANEPLSSLPEQSTFAHNYMHELKSHGTLPFFLTSLLMQYTSDYIYNRQPNHLKHIATSALMAPLAHRFAVLPALTMSRLTMNPQADSVDELFQRVSATKNSIRPVLAGMGTWVVSSLGMLTLAKKLVGNNPSALQTAGCFVTGLMVPALIVKIDEWAQESDEVVKKGKKDRPRKKPLTKLS